tara:strand:+ start:2002 stop:3045 length:1044 start_codon:yes stop_codon:yes gene_type:complete
MEKKDLTSKLEAIRELRRMHGNSKITIGMKEAHDYLKSQNEYIGLREEVVKGLRDNGSDYSPSLREIINVCDDARMFSNGLVDFQVVGFSLDNVFINKEVFVKSYLGKSLADSEDIELGFDYGSFIHDYYNTRRLAGIEDGEKDLSKVDMDAEAFAVLIDEGLKEGKYLLNGEGEKVSVDELLNEELLKDSTLDIESIAGYNSQSVYEFIEERREGIGFNLGRSMDSWGTERHERITNEEVAYLYPSVIKRAKREQILNKLEVERLIAHNIFVQKQEEGVSFDEDLDSLIHGWEKRRKKRAERLGRFRKLKAPDIMINSEQRLFEEASYELLALKKNKDWLKRVLGH